MIAGTRSTTLKQVSTIRLFSNLKGVIHDSDDGSTSSLVNADLLAKSLEETTLVSEKVDEKLKISRERMKRQVEKKGRSKISFEVGDHVLIRKEIRTTKKQQRIMVPMWDFRLARVTEITRNYQYELEMENTIIPQHGLSLLLDGQQNEKRTYGLPQRLWIQNLQRQKEAKEERKKKYHLPRRKEQNFWS